MTGTVAPMREMRQLAASAASAEDAALLRLVRLLDSLPDRGDADRVLEPARGRLQTLKPERPIRLSRLLFLPLDGAILPPARWRRGGHEIPRSAILPVAAAVEAALGVEAAEIQCDADGHGMGEDAVLATLGARLWPAAASALPEAPPPGWAEAGLAAEDWPPIREILVPLFAAGVPIFGAMRAAALGPPPSLIRAALVGPAAAGPRPLAATLAALLRSAAAPGAVLLAANEFGPAGRAVGARMIDAAMALLPDPGATGLQDAAQAASRFFGGVADLASSGLLDPDRTRRLMAMRHATDEACRRRITESGAAQVVGALATLRNAPSIEEAAITEVERDARAIRALAQVGRGAGDPAVYDRALRGLSEQVGVLRGGLAAAPDGLTPVDLARVVEILSGPDAAAAMLLGAPGG